MDCIEFHYSRATSNNKITIFVHVYVLLGALLLQNSAMAGRATSFVSYTHPKNALFTEAFVCCGMLIFQQQQILRCMPHPHSHSAQWFKNRGRVDINKFRKINDAL